MKEVFKQNVTHKSIEVEYPTPEQITAWGETGSITLQGYVEGVPAFTVRQDRTESGPTFVAEGLGVSAPAEERASKTLMGWVRRAYVEDLI